MLISDSWCSKTSVEYLMTILLKLLDNLVTETMSKEIEMFEISEKEDVVGT
jgi:hypothetical protein